MARKKKENLEEVLEEALEDVVDEPEYSSHKQQVLESSPTPERIADLENALLDAYGKVVKYFDVPFICFGDLSAEELAAAFFSHPIIIKATCSCVNVAQRAIKRDLGFDFDTYTDKIDLHRAAILAGYLKPLLPDRIAVPALMELDRYFWTDKEMRAKKGQWEIEVRKEISAQSSVTFRKRKFEYEGEEFEIDAAYPTEGVEIKVAVDVKRIESPRDIHKRADEIINKATKFKAAHPEGKFYAFVYYPFPNQHINVQSRLHSAYIDAVFFAAQTPSSISAAVDLLVGMLGLKKN